MNIADPIELYPKPEYNADVVLRNVHKATEVTDTGAKIYSDLVTFSDSLGRQIVRELTIAEPNPNGRFQSPYPIVETDPWTTGSEGLNKDKIRNYSKLGYSVVWLHHAGKESPIGFDKSISRSAHQMHAVLNTMQQSSDFDTSQVILGGYSRGAMTAEKFIALASDYNREVPYSDTEAPCFVRDMSGKEKIDAILRQVPSEAHGIAIAAIKIARKAFLENNPSLLKEYARTFDLHPLNIAHELLWAKALINSNVGQSIGSLPKSTTGIRTFFSKDIMSQQADHEELYKEFPGISVATEIGPHVAGAYPEYLQKKYNRLNRVGNYIAENGTLLGITLEDLQGPKPVRITPIRHFGAVS